MTKKEDVKSSAPANRFVDAEDWAAAGFTGIAEPTVTVAMVEAHAAMVANNQNPFFVLDPGFSWQYMKDNFGTFGFTDGTQFRLSNINNPEDNWHLKQRDPQWLLFPGGATGYLGIVPDSPSKTWQDQVDFLDTNYPNMRFADPSEFSIAMLIVWKTHGLKICAHPCSARTSQTQNGGHAAVSGGYGFVTIHTLTNSYNHWYYGAVAVYDF